MMQEVHRTCGTLVHTANASCRTVVTYQDITVNPAHSYRPLPLTVTAGETAELDIGTGKIPGEASLILGYKGDATSVIINGKPADAGTEYLDDPYYKTGDCAFVSCTFPAGELTRHHIAITAPTDLTVVYAEIRFH